MPKLIPCANPAACGVVHGHKPGTVCRSARTATFPGSVVPVTSASIQNLDRDLIESLNAKGWPRPRVEATVDGKTSPWPMPWVSKTALVEGKITHLLGAVDADRYEEIIDQWLCQVCGQECSQTAYAPVSPDVADSSAMFIYNGPLCSVRCARLALALCPHFKGSTDIVSFDRDNSAASQYEDLLNIDSFEFVSEETEEQRASALEQHQREQLADFMFEHSGTWRSRQDRSVMQLRQEVSTSGAVALERWARTSAKDPRRATEAIDQIMETFDDLPEDWRSRYDTRS